MSRFYSVDLRDQVRVFRSREARDRHCERTGDYKVDAELALELARETGKGNR